jgi:hypothetical protein
MMRNRGTVGVLVTAVAAFAGLAAYQAVRAADAREMEDRMRVLEDHLQIEQLLMRYAVALNTEDADAYVSMFTPDAVFELKRNVDEPPFLGPFTGRDALPLRERARSE